MIYLRNTASKYSIILTFMIQYDLFFVNLFDIINVTQGE